MATGPRSNTRSTKAYDQHRPAETALVELVTEHLETFLATAREAHERGPSRSSSACSSRETTVRSQR